MQQNRINILTTTLLQSTKCFVGVLRMSILCIEPTIFTGNTIQLKHTLSRIL